MNNFIFAFAFLSLMLIPFGTVNVFAETQTKSSSDNSLDVKISLNVLVSGEETRLKIEFFDPLTDKI